MPRNRTHYRITLADALEGHRLALTFSGRSGILNRSLLESAIARPYSGHYRLIHQKTAALVHGVVKNHAFVDGNKRTAVFLMDLLLKRSGYRLEARDKSKGDVALEEMILDVANGSMTVSEIADWFRQRIRPT